MSGRIALNALVSALLALMVLPILAVVPASFSRSSFIALPPASWSLRWYETFFAQPEWLATLANSGKVAALAMAIALVAGTMMALGMERLPPALRRLALTLALAPMIVPVIVITVALYFVARQLGLVGTTIGLALGHALLCLPFVVLNVGVSLRGMDPALLRAAEGLGASPTRAFRTVTLPLIAPGLVGGAVFAFITSFDEVVISIFLAGVTTKTLPVKIWEVIRLEYTPIVAVAASVMIGLTVLLFLGARLSTRGGGPTMAR